jgi:hypothetical protein
MSDLYLTWDKATAIPRLTTQLINLSLVSWYGSSHFLTLMLY